MECERKTDCPVVLAAVEEKVKAEHELMVRRSVFNVFFQAVRDMRKLQKEYFQNRTSLLLFESKKQERRVDAEIVRLMKLKDKVFEQAELALETDPEGGSDDAP